ncbi:MAG: hypothetical protein LKI24_06750 [Acidipropionibacterium sp.]|jgi:hypothetical protein|nr:hypothetical protein [Acidipropionibacterium sp.]
MPSEGLRGLVERGVGPISLPIYEGVAAGLADALEVGRRRKYLLERHYSFLLSMHARVSMREGWKTSLVPTGWRVGGEPQRMGQTILCSPDNGLRLRLLKENARVYKGGVPTAGHNRARRDLWERQEWQDPLPGMNSGAGAVGASGLMPSVDFLLLWDFAMDEEERPRISTRVVHTIGTGHFGSAVPIDLSYEISSHGEMQLELEFPGEEQDESLFPDIKEEDNGDEASGR